MGLFTNNKNGGIMDVIRCDEKDYLVWKWRPEGSAEGEVSRENAIRWGSVLRVKEGSVAVLVYTGKEGFAQEIIEGPAEKVLDTKNLPVISSLVGLAYNGGSPFSAEVYFINLAKTIPMNFAVPYFNVFDSDPELANFPIPVAVHGKVELNIKDYAAFVRCHRLDSVSISELQEKIKDELSGTVISIVTNAPFKFQIPVIQIERFTEEIRSAIVDAFKPRAAEKYGIHLVDIAIKAIHINKEDGRYKTFLSVTQDVKRAGIRAKAVNEIKQMNDDRRLGNFGRALDMLNPNRETAAEKHARKEEAADNRLNRITKMAGAFTELMGTAAEKHARKEESADNRMERFTKMAGVLAGLKEKTDDSKAQRDLETAREMADIEEDRYARHAATQTKYASAVENERAGRFGAASAKIIGAFGKLGSAKVQEDDFSAPPPVQIKEYYVVLYGKKNGPHDISTLRQMAADGLISSETLAWTNGMGDWMPLRELDDVVSILQNEDSIPPVPPVPQQ